jgi:hypothetical protein
MATFHAIAATGEAILGLLKAARPSGFENVQFLLYQSNDFQNTPPPLEGITLYLYRVEVNTTRRNLPPRIDSDGQRYRASLPIDLHYLLIPWAKTAARQQSLLGWGMRVLEDTPILPATLLNYHASEADTFRLNEAVELVSEPLSLQEIVNIWDAFKPNLQLSVAYVARMIMIDSQVELNVARPAQTREFDMAKELMQ